MVESIKHLSDAINFKDLKVDAKVNIHYKSKVHTECNARYRDLSNLSEENWKEIIELHLIECDFITNRGIE
jgi:hypothetical protein